MPAAPGVTLPAGVVAALPSVPIAFQDLARPWASRTRTVLATLASGEAVVVQVSGDRRGLARRIRVATWLRRVAPALTVPEVLVAGAAATPPFLVTRFVPGSAGSELLDADPEAAMLGRLMGTLAREIARVEPRGLRLSERWADPVRLTVAGHSWLREAAADLGPTTAWTVGGRIDAIETELGAFRPVLAHGDFAPVNVIVRDGAIVALLDLERARLAHPLFDAAWWRWIVRHHHPERWDAAGPPFLEAAAIQDDPVTRSRLDLLAILQCLEMLAATPRRADHVRRAWASRIDGIVAADGGSLPARAGGTVRRRSGG